MKAVIVNMEREDRLYIEKVVAFLHSLEGAQKSKMSVMTNTRLPTRFMCVVNNLPPITMRELEHISALTNNLKSMHIDLQQSKLTLEAWKTHANKRKKRARSPSPTSGFMFKSSEDWDLSAIHIEDRNTAKRVIEAIGNMPQLDCQFQVTVESKPPTCYELNLKIRDVMSYAVFRAFHREFRAFVGKIIFDFPQKVVRVTVKRMHAPANIL